MLPTDGVTLSYTHPNQLTVVNSVSVKDDFNSTSYQLMHNTINTFINYFVYV